MTFPLQLPLTALAHSKHLVNWIKQQQQQQQQCGVDVGDVVDLMRHIRLLLHQAVAAGQLVEGEGEGGRQQ